MCRILMVRSQTAFQVREWLPDFAEMCRESKEFQGHGWGMAMRLNGQWRVHKNLDPIWEDNHNGFGSCDFLIVHARSAFRDEGIVLENNMPFYDDNHFFIFNGELHGVKIREAGRIGAEKIFNYIKRFDKGRLEDAFQKALGIITRRTSYIRAMNILMTDGEKIYANTQYGEDPDYFTLFHQKGDKEAFCSQPLGGEWEALPNNTLMVR